MGGAVAAPNAVTKATGMRASPSCRRLLRNFFLDELGGGGRGVDVGKRDLALLGFTKGSMALCAPPSTAHFLKRRSASAAGHCGMGPATLSARGSLSPNGKQGVGSFLDKYRPYGLKTTSSAFQRFAKKLLKSVDSRLDVVG